MSIRLVWLDLETTGLDPQRDEILEIASIITDKYFQEQDQARFHALVRPVTHPLESMTFASHLTTGLYKEAVEFGFRLGAVLGDLEGFFRKQLAYNDDIYLAGNNPHFDKSFLPADLFRRFSYRHLNMSVFKVFSDLGHIQTFYPSTGSTKHRAMGDLEHSIAHAKFIMDNYLAKGKDWKPPFGNTIKPSTCGEDPSHP